MKFGFIGRFKPVHNGAVVLLETLCNEADMLTIGIGSSNKYNVRNPWTAEESKQMLESLLKPRTNYQILKIPDSGHLPEFRDGQKWRDYVVEHFRELDYFVTGNGYVANLLKDHYQIIHPGDLIPKKKQVFLKATEVRVAMAKNENWQQHVPQKVAEYIMENKLDERFRKEFGLKTLATLADNYWMPENFEQEKAHTFEK